jgi:hypothetical protein
MMLNLIRASPGCKIANRKIFLNEEKTNFLSLFSVNSLGIVSSLKTLKETKVDDIINKIDLINANAVFLSLLCLTVLSLITKKIFKKNVRAYLRLVPLYILLIIVQLSFGNYVIFGALPDERKKYLVNLSAFVFTVLEYLIFSILLSKFIKLPIIKKYLRLSSIPFAVLGIISWHFISLSTNALSFITAAESILLIPFCLYYFYELLNIPPFLKITDEPSFWITTGILFLFICITPYYLAFDYFKNIYEVQMIDFFGYDLMVLFLAKASFTKSKSVNG